MHAQKVAGRQELGLSGEMDPKIRAADAAAANALFIFLLSEPPRRQKLPRQVKPYAHSQAVIRVLQPQRISQESRIFTDLEPPFEPSLPARRRWDGLARDLHGQGRWDAISHDLLAAFCQLLHLSQECLTAILADGVVVAGSRSDRDRVRHPLWTPYTQCQQNLIRLARSIPLVDPKADHSGAALDSWIDELVPE